LVLAVEAITAADENDAEAAQQALSICPARADVVHGRNPITLES
jgi:hypothetical protein